MGIVEKFRDCPISQGMTRWVRNTDTDERAGMRQELMDLTFFLAGKGNQTVVDVRIYRIVSQSLGIGPYGDPYAASLTQRFVMATAHHIRPEHSVWDHNTRRTHDG